ncbi:MAG: ECF RNA polymerase sigma factor SigW [Pelotomaculum sp. PtaB.Bin104]|nr:MAG: ECF RNA polymerase sigma factor SigW [Pelotomaculum sp. PtaB.Bin104]
MNEDASERKLVLAAQAGDKEAFSELTQRHAGYSYRVAYSILQNQSEAEDLTQEAILTCYRKLADFRLESSFRTWLSRITVNLCYDYLRKKRREGALLGKMADRETAAAKDWVGRIDQSMELKNAIKMLSDSHRAVLVMYYEMDLDVKSVARLLKIPVGTVKSRLAGARATLREILERG